MKHEDAALMIVYSQRMAAFLMMKGFGLKNVEPNIKQPDRNVFIFFNSRELRDAMEEYKNKK